VHRLGVVLVDLGDGLLGHRLQCVLSAGSSCFCMVNLL
jgi:hypothetical protein